MAKSEMNGFNISVHFAVQNLFFPTNILKSESEMNGINIVVHFAVQNLWPIKEE